MGGGVLGLRRVLTRRLPPHVRRAAAGLLLDLQSVPERLRDREKRGAPLQSRHHVGGGDFHAMGEALLARLVESAGLTPDDRVLDIGCGTGRVARPLAAFLSARGRYAGFDVGRSAIKGCRRRFRRTRPDFRFEHADVRNLDYNPRGRTAASDYRFPFEDGAFTLAFAFSVFTHMRPAAVERYLAEAARVLAPGGRLLFTAYLLDPRRVQALEEGRAGLPLQPWEDGCRVQDRSAPERAIAYPVERILAAAAGAGLEAAPPVYGQWAPPSAGPDWQDLIVARKPGAP